MVLRSGLADESLFIGQPGVSDPRSRGRCQDSYGVRYAGDLDCDWIAQETGYSWFVSEGTESVDALVHLYEQRAAIRQLLHRDDLPNSVLDLCESKIRSIGLAIPPLAEMIAQDEEETDADN